MLYPPILTLVNILSVVIMWLRSGEDLGTSNTCLWLGRCCGCVLGWKCIFFSEEHAENHVSVGKFDCANNILFFPFRSQSLYLCRKQTVTQQQPLLIAPRLMCLVWSTNQIQKNNKPNRASLVVFLGTKVIVHCENGLMFFWCLHNKCGIEMSIWWNLIVSPNSHPRLMVEL